MKRLYTVLLLLLFSVTMGTGRLAGQDAERPYDALLMSKLLLYDTQQVSQAMGVSTFPASEDPGDLTLKTLADATRNRKLANTILKTGLVRYYGVRAGAKSAAQVSQAHDEAAIQLQLFEVAQNQRIIELLEQLTKTPPRKP